MEDRRYKVKKGSKLLKIYKKISRRKKGKSACVCVRANFVLNIIKINF